LAHFVRINDEVLQDFSNFRQVIGQELLAGLIDAENSQLLVGSGTPPNLTGLLTTTGILTRARGTDSNLDAVLKAKADLRVGASFAEPDGLIVHPSNLSTIQLAKDSQGRYITNDPAQSGPETLFGMRLIPTTKVTLGTALMGNFAEAARLYVRQSPVVEVAPLGGGTVEFIANQTLARAEGEHPPQCRCRNYPSGSDADGGKIPTPHGLIGAAATETEEGSRPLDRHRRLNHGVRHSPVKRCYDFAHPATPLVRSNT